MATMNVSLPDPMKSWVEDRLQDGRFSNTSDYVRHLIRRDQEREDAKASLQHAIDEGMRSGTVEEFDFQAFRAQMREKYASE